MGMKRFITALKASTMAIAAVGLMATSAMATDGMFGDGTGARNKALAGAGVADEKDATAMSLNPAGLVHSDTQFNAAASLFSPRREYNVGAGVVKSDSEYFVIPNLAYAYRVDGNTVFGLSMYGNGGMNTDYPVNFTGLPANLGIDLTQVFMSAGLAKQYGNLSIGVAPILALQLFSANGTPTRTGIGSEHLDVAAGIAVRAGVEWAVADNFRVAVAGASPTYMQAFTSYDQPGELFGLDGGRLNLPGTIQAGIALDLMPTLTVMADYKRIFYGAEKVIGSSTNVGGFGWSDINIYKFGVEWDATPGLTLRAGYSYNDSPLPTNASAYFANILAPATVKHHFTGGAKIKVSDSMDFEIAGMYAPEETVRTPGVAPFNNPAIGAFPPSTVKMHQYEATVGIVWHLGDTEAPLK